MPELEGLISPEHIGDGLYMRDKGHCVDIAVNHHNNTVAVLDVSDIDHAIKYLQKVRDRMKEDYNRSR